MFVRGGTCPHDGFPIDTFPEEYLSLTNNCADASDANFSQEIDYDENKNSVDGTHRQYFSSNTGMGVPA